MAANDSAEQNVDGGGYTVKQVSVFEEPIRKLRNEGARLKFDLAHLSGQLSAPRAKTFLRQGVGRRLYVIERCALNIFEIFPPAREKFLSIDECTDIAIQFQSFAVYVYGLFDNIAWVSLLEAGQNLPEMKIGLFKKDCRPFIPKKLAAYLSEPDTTRWFERYGKLYRDSTVHRMAPYLPPRAYTPEEGQRWQELD